MRVENGARVTDAGHDPEALMLLWGALVPYVDDPFAVAAEVFAVLHDAGIRFSPSGID